MDTIEFRLSALNHFGREISTAVADIFINGHPLWENFFKESASISVAELYKNLSAKYQVDSVAILGCGVPESFPVFVTVEICADTVVWKNFVTPQNSPKIFDEFVFDGEQYFREVDKLKRWSETDSLTVEYGGIECGYITLLVKKKSQAFAFYFDECLDDPLPALVKFFNAVRGEDFAETEIKDYDDKVDFKLSFRPWTDGHIKFFVELVRKKIIFYEIYRCEELAAMLKRIFDSLLNDRYFPYSYPCFWYICESDEPDGEVTDAIEAEHPDWALGDLMNYAFTDGQQKLSPPLENYLSTYKKMLTDYVVPEGWC